MERIEIAPNHPVLNNAPQDLALVMEEKFKPFEDQAAEWMTKAKALVVTDVTEVEKMKEARVARLALKNIRVQVEKLHKAEKDEFLKGGRTIDTIKNKLVSLIEPIEKHLQEQEDYAAIQEAKARKELLESRLKQLEPYRTMGDGMQNVPFGDIPEATFQNILLGMKAAKEARENQAREAERIRQENEENARKERERIKAENEKFLKIQRRTQRISALGFKWDEEKKMHVFQLKNGPIEIWGDLSIPPDDEFDKALNIAYQAISKHHEQQRQEANELAAKLKEETEARQKLEKEKQEAEAKRIAEEKRIAAEKRKAARQPDKVKLLNFAERIALIEPITINSDEARDVYDKASRDLQTVVAYIKTEAEKL